jgi:HSP20 family molecular chaperone IbpA
MPGARDDELRVRVDGLRLVIEADGEKRYYASVDLPDDVDPLTLESTYTNGVLDATLKRREPVPRA